MVCASKDDVTIHKIGLHGKTHLRINQKFIRQQDDLDSFTADVFYYMSSEQHLMNNFISIRSLCKHSETCRTNMHLSWFECPTAG